MRGSAVADVSGPPEQESTQTDLALTPRQWRLGVPAVLVLGTVLGSVELATHGLFLDESVSSTLAVAPWHRFADVVTHREANMALYYLLLRGWVVFGHSEIALRSLSVLIAVGALWVLVLLARRLFSQRVALLAGLLLAVNPLFIQFAQDVRGYSLALLLVTASCFFFVRGMDQESSPPLCWTAYTAVTALAAYSNFWAALVPLGQALSLAFLPAARIPWRRILASALALAVLLVPLGLLIQATDNAGVNWASGSSAGRLIVRVQSTVPHAVLDAFVLLLVVGVVALIVLARRLPDLAALFERRWPLFFTLCWLLVPVAAVVMVSLVDKPLIVVRYLMVSLPAAILVLAVVIDSVAFMARRGARVAGAVLLAVVLFGSLVGTAQWYRQGGPQDYRPVVAFLAAHAQPGDGVLVFAPYERIPVEWYLDQRPEAERTLHPVYPATAWGVDPLYFDGNVRLPSAAVEQAAEKYQRIWLVSATADLSLYPDEVAAVDGALRSAGFKPVGTTHFRGVQVTEEQRQ
jgi:mannosyltransferase